jgi:hypothetical protein
MDIDWKELLDAAGATAKNLADGSFDEGDVVVLTKVKEIIEDLLENGLSDDIQKPLVQKILLGIALVVDLGMSDVIMGLVLSDDE